MENIESQNNRQEYLPKPEAPKKLLDAIKDNTLIARRLYLVYLLLSAYCFLVALGATDYQMLTNQASKLPISSFDIFISPITLFVLAFPVSVSIFIYFQLYLHKLNQLITRLHDNYDSKELMFISPWIINFAKYPEKGAIGKLQNMVATITLWYLLPLLLTFISIRFIKTHLPVLSYIMGMTPFFAALIVLWFRNSYDSTKLFKNFSSNIKRFLVILIFLIFSGLLTIIVVPRANNGIPIKFLNGVMFYDLSYQNFGDNKTNDSLNRYGNNWGGINLAGANLRSSVLVRSYLAKASLKGANLTYTNFEQSNFEMADLSRIDGAGANMRECNFYQAMIANSNLIEANLSKAKLVYANIAESDLSRANMTKIDGSFSLMKECIFTGAKINGAKFSYANLANSSFERAEIKSSNLIYAILSFANLQNADLMNSDFYEAKLNGANFDGANITSAVFGYSDLSDAKNLTVEQLCKTITLFGAKLDSGLMEQVKKSCPQLLEDPGKETEKKQGIRVGPR